MFSMDILTKQITMCIISVKNKGVNMPTNKTIRIMFETNSHGAGYMLQRKSKGSIIIEKGFDNVDKFIKAVGKLKVNKEDTFAMHFRIATSGGVNKEMCHPFVVNTDPTIANAVSMVVKDDPCFMHNGIIRDLNGIHDDYSDTSLFAMQYLAENAIIGNVYESTAIQEMIAKFIDESRLSILHPEKGMILIGEWEKDEDGNFYSNSGYKPYKYSSYGSYGSGWNSRNSWDYKSTSYHGKNNSKSLGKTNGSTTKMIGESAVEKQARDIDKAAEKYSGQTLGSSPASDTSDDVNDFFEVNGIKEFFTMDRVPYTLAQFKEVFFPNLFVLPINLHMKKKATVRRQYQKLFRTNPIKGLGYFEMIAEMKAFYGDLMVQIRDYYVEYSKADREWYYNEDCKMGLVCKASVQQENNYYFESTTEEDSGSCEFCISVEPLTECKVFGKDYQLCVGCKTSMLTNETIADGFESDDTTDVPF